MTHYKETKYGFEFGSAIIERCISDKGWVTVSIKTPKHLNPPIAVYVTKTGKVRIFCKGEWKNMEVKKINKPKNKKSRRLIKK